MSSRTRILIRNEIISIFPKLAELRDHLDLFRQSFIWRRKGWQVPLPHLVKRAILKAEAGRMQAEIFVETGTYLGDTPWFMRDVFRQIYSIEVEPTLAMLARHRFRNFSKVKIVEGDSSKKLSELAVQIDGPSLVWLDGHYSAGITGCGAKDCPVWEELEAIAELWKWPVSIFIDDARCFGQSGECSGYPQIGQIRDYAARRFPNHLFSIENDIIMLKHFSGRH